MPLTPLDIQNKEFRRSLRGYNEQDVDEFLDDVVREMETMIREGAALKEQIARLEERLGQYVDIEDVLKRTLVKAEEAAGGMRAAAQKEAELLLRETQEQARQMIEAARRECTAEREDLTRIRREYRNFLARVKGELRVQLEAVDALADGLNAAGAKQSEVMAHQEPLAPPPGLDQPTTAAAEPRPQDESKAGAS